MTADRRITRGHFIGGALALATVSISFRPRPVGATGAAPFLGDEGFPYELFDTLKTTDIEVGGATIHIGFAPIRFTLPKAVVVARIAKAAQAVATYYGHFPVRSARFLVVPVEGEGVLGGTTWGYNGAASRILLGLDTTSDELDSDWVTTHEMVHLALPDMSQSYNWLSEGLAVYVEPIARVQAGQMAAASIWSDMKRDMPKGQPRSGDAGLDGSTSWGRIYWGGALFCLEADVRLRKVTDNRVGLQTAMRGVLAAGGNHEVDWTIEKILAVADKATGQHVLRDLYDEVKAKPVRFDLDGLWRDLGVEGAPGAIRLRDDAPLASLRTAITLRPAT